ncbi:uncharacterized protein LOC112686300 [Sipha flava]|uniref:Uncharacterized protein LOC112686300 n=1 Tax=Sipha flava TaxID=143950 RepID=A0A8B8FU28_9HEMI|nr:uncharacterized protein LOC112686300 [Sipha flava]
MELSLNIEQLQLKSEYLHSNPRCTHFHKNVENPLFISWDDCVTVLYSLNNLDEASVWNPIEPVILPISNPIISVFTFGLKIYCIDKNGSVYHLKQIHRDSPDLFGCSSVQVSPQLQSCDCKWISFYSQKYPCNIFGMSCYSEGIAVITTLNEWITIQFLQINIDDDGEPVIHNNCSQQIRQQKQFPFVVTSFVSCTWRDWFTCQRAKELFGSNVINSRDIFILATEESKVYYSTSDVTCKNVSLFLNCPQKIVHIQFCDFESKKMLLVSSSGILTVMDCVESVASSFIYLSVTEVVAIFFVDCTIILSDSIHLFIITLDKHFSKIVKQVVTPLKGVLSLHKFLLNNIIAMTQLNKVYKLSPNYQIITQEENKFKFNEEIVLKKIKDLCKNVESIEKQQEKMDLFINAVSIVARKDLIAQYCSFDVLIYSGAKAVKLGACQDQYILAIKLSTDCPWLSFSSTIWQLLVRVTDSKNSSSNCGLHPFNIDLFNNNHPLIVKHHLFATLAENCTSGFVYCDLVCQVQNELMNRFLIIPLNPVKLNALYFVKAEKREKIPVINPMEDRHKYVFKYPDNLSLTECLTIITERNKHRISKSLYTNITVSTPKTLYFNLFDKIVSITFDNEITKTIVLECINLDALISVRNAVFNELSNDQSVNIKYSVLADTQKQLCVLEELSERDRLDENIIKEIKSKILNQISVNLPA